MPPNPRFNAARQAKDVFFGGEKNLDFAPEAKYEGADSEFVEMHRPVPVEDGELVSPCRAPDDAVHRLQLKRWSFWY